MPRIKRKVDSTTSLQTVSPVRTSQNPVLLLILIALAFAAGYFYFKTQNLEKIAAGNAGTQQAGNKQPPQQPPQDLKAMPALTNKDHIRGDKNADIILVEYSDYECPFCKQFHPSMQQAMQDYGTKVTWVYRHFPLSFHQNAQKEAEASECVNELGGNDAFWSFTDKIFERTTSNGTGFALEKLGPLAAEIGIDQQSFQKCLDSDKYANHVKEDEAGGAKAGVNGTPGTIIVAKNGKRDMINGASPYSTVKQQIDALLK